MCVLKIGDPRAAHFIPRAAHFILLGWTPMFGRHSKQLA